MKARLLPLYFAAANERERGEFNDQLVRLKDFYGDVAEFLEPVCVGDKIPKADAIVFPQLIGAAFKESEQLKKINLPMVVLTSKFGTVEMWDWEIVTYLREKGLNVFSPYNIELAKVVIRAISAKEKLKGAKFLTFQDSPGEGMQANIFKRFYWWEKECTDLMEKTFGLKMIYRSWKELNEKARQISDDVARKACTNWDLNISKDLSEENYLKSVKIYVAVKEVIDELGGVDGVGANCLNESFHSDTTPCLAWNMIFEKDNIIWACEGDTLTLLSTFILYRTLEAPIMMTNIYPFLVGMAALAHEKIDKFPDIDDPDNHALGVHCGFFGLVPPSFCTDWELCPKALAIVNDDAVAVNCRMPKGPITLAKIYPDFKRLSIIEAEIEDYVQYPGSDCRNGALIRYKDGHKVMEALCSHHALIIVGNKKTELLQLAKVFGFEAQVL